MTKEVNAQDRRLVVLRLTAEGGALMRELKGIAAAYQAQLEALLAPELMAMNRAIDRILAEEL
ncbi:hypothetical protein [Marinovum sp. KMM 9879]